MDKDESLNRNPTNDDEEWVPDEPSPREEVLTKVSLADQVASTTPSTSTEPTFRCDDESSYQYSSDEDMLD